MRPALRVFYAFAICLLVTAVAPTVGAAADPVVLQTRIVNDPQGTGGEVFRLLVPKGWSFDGGVVWNTERFPAEAFTSYTVVSPDGASVFQQFPHTTLFWAQDPMMQQSYMQNGFAILPPVGAEQALRELYLPNYRPEASGAEILESQPLPELARQTLQWQQILLNIFGSISPFTFQYEIRADAARAKFRYTVAGTPVIEDATVVLSYFIAYMPSLSGTVPAITWSASPTSFRAPAAEMDNRLETFRTIAASRRDNPAWHEHITKLYAMITREQLRQQRAIFDRLQQIHRTQAETSDMMFESWQKRSQAYDRIFDNYSRSLRGVDTYADPISSRQVELPNGYRHAWSNGSDYVLSDDPAFNPNTGSTQTWTEIHPQR
jgi:hypothetical protein